MSSPIIIITQPPPPPPPTHGGATSQSSMPAVQSSLSKKIVRQILQNAIESLGEDHAAD